MPKPAAAVLLLAVLLAPPASSQSTVWIQQVGGAFLDDARIATDAAGNVFVGGHTTGNLGGTSTGTLDAWVGRYDLAGNPIWIHQFGTLNGDGLLALAPDGTGAVYAAGYTYGALFSPNLGLTDGWLTRRAASGVTAWNLQIGTFEDDAATAVAGDGSGGVFVGGHTWGSLGGPHIGPLYSDVWLARYDAAGTQLWARQLGSTARDELMTMVADGSGGVFLGGLTYGDVVGTNAGFIDAWYGRYDGAGNQLWLRQVGTAAEDRVQAAAPDGAGGVYLCGATRGALMGAYQGESDAWVARVGPQGQSLWTRQFGTPEVDDALAASLRPLGGVLVAGSTYGDLEGASQGLADGWVRHYGPNGDVIATKQFGTPQGDVVLGIAAQGTGQYLVSGSTTGDITGTGTVFGGYDAWFALEGAICDSGTPYCVASLTSLPGCQASISASGLPSVSNPGGYTISSGTIPGGQLGIGVFSASGPASFPLGTLGGKACFLPPIFRTAAKLGGGTKGLCNGALTLTLQDLINASPVVVPGAVLGVEFWARDPDNVDGFLLSNAIQFAVCP